MKSLFLVVATLCVFSSTVHAADPREELKQLTAQLQSNPSDTALRERIIKLAQTIKPAPPLPEEAERRMARGAAAFKGAKSQSDFKDAAREFEQASLAAPWSGDIYYNLGLAQDKAGDHALAVRSLKLALLALPTSKETKSLLYEVEYRAEKANLPEVQAARTREQQEAMIRSLDGAMFGHEFRDAAGTVTARFAVEVRGKQATWTSFDVPNRETDTMNCVLDGRGCVLRGGPWKVALEISADGQQTSVFSYDPSGNLAQTIVHQRRR